MRLGQGSRCCAHRAPSSPCASCHSLAGLDQPSCASLSEPPPFPSPQIPLANAGRVVPGAAVTPLPSACRLNRGLPGATQSPALRVGGGLCCPRPRAVSAPSLFLPLMFSRPFLLHLSPSLFLLSSLQLPLLRNLGLGLSSLGRFDISRCSPESQAESFPFICPRWPPAPGHHPTHLGQRGAAWKGGSPRAAPSIRGSLLPQCGVLHQELFLSGSDLLWLAASR